jgi:hypothetical protein
MTDANSALLSRSNAFIETGLHERLKDDSYRRELAEGIFDTETHPELVIGARWEQRRLSLLPIV